MLNPAAPEFAPRLRRGAAAAAVDRIQETAGQEGSWKVTLIFFIPDRFVQNLHAQAKCLRVNPFQ